MYPTLPTLSRIALVFNLGQDYFFSDEKEWRTFAVVRKKDRLRFPEATAFDFESPDYLATDRKFNAYLADFRTVPAEKIRLHQDAGVEFIHALKGRLALKVGAELQHLDGGDSL